MKALSQLLEVKVRLGGLALLAADFMGSAKFQDVPFELKRTGCEVDVIPKLWIPARGPISIHFNDDVISIHVNDIILNIY